MMICRCCFAYLLFCLFGIWKFFFAFLFLSSDFTIVIISCNIIFAFKFLNYFVLPFYVNLSFMSILFHFCLLVCSNSSCLIFSFICCFFFFLYSIFFIFCVFTVH